MKLRSIQSLMLVALYIGVLLSLSGCGQKEAIKTENFQYTVSVVASDVAKQNFAAEIWEKELQLQEIETAVGLKVERDIFGNTEIIRSVNGVLSTRSMMWKLYIDGKKIDGVQTRHVPVAPLQKIEWRYESVSR